jgi:hypothetical protein
MMVVVTTAGVLSTASLAPQECSRWGVTNLVMLAGMHPGWTLGVVEAVFVVSVVGRGAG